MKCLSRVHKIYKICLTFVGIIVFILGFDGRCFAETLNSLTVVMDDNYPPYSFKNAEGRLVGILPNLWQLWEAHTGIKVEIVGTCWSNAQKMLNEGKADVIDGIFRTPEREEIYAFSKAYAEIPVGIYHVREITGLADVSCLHGFVVAVKRGDASIDKLKENGINSLIFYPSYEAIIRDAKNGNVKVFCMDDPPANYYLNKYGIADKFRRAFTLYKGSFHRAVLKRNVNILGSIEQGFASIRKSDIDMIYKKWMGTHVVSRRFVKHGIYILSALLVVVGCVVLWNLSLSKMVKNRTLELKRALEEVKKQQDFLKTTLYSIGEGVVIVGPDNRILHMNEVAERLTGWKEYEAKGRDLSEVFKVVDEKTGDDITHFFTAFFHSESKLQSDHMLLISKSGEKYPILCSRSPIRHGQSSNGTQGIVLVFRDQTGEREKRRELERAYMQLNVALEGADLVLANIYLPDKTLNTSRKFMELIGMSESEFLPSLSFVEDLIHPEDRDRVVSRFHEHLSGKIDFFEERFKLCHKRGHFIPVHARGRVIEWDEHGEPSWFSGVIMDISEWTSMSEKLKTMERQLAQAAKLEALGRLAGGIAHDFNNVLQVIFSQSELALLEVDSKSHVAERIKEIRKIADKAANITRQLLAFAKKQEAEPRVLNVNNYIRNSAKIFEKFVGENTNLRIELSSDEWEIFIDPAQLDQILLNLLVNAKDALQNGGTIWIRTENAVVNESDGLGESYNISQGEYVKLSVEDDGCGMTEEILERIFEPFFTTKGDKGSGLGLSTVYGIVKQNNGYIFVDSKVGSGTRVDIYFPRYVPNRQESRKLFEHSDENGFVNSQARTILLVEDEDLILSLLTELLEQGGYKVHAFSLPDEAIEFVRSQLSETIDLLITDVVMPRMSGCQLLRELRKLCPSVKCLFISAYPDDVIKQNGYEGDCLFLRKPFTRKELFEKLSMIFAG